MSLNALLYFLFLAILTFSIFSCDSNDNRHDDSDDSAYRNTHFVQSLAPVKQNCTDTIRLCGNDDDCFQGCFQSLDYKCFNQVCVKRYQVADSDDNGEKNDECKTDLGIVYLLHSDGKFRCTSLYPHFFDNFGKRTPYACNNGGSVVFEKNEKNQNVPVCKCKDGYQLVVHADTNFIPRCYDPTIENLVEYRAL